MLKAHYIFTILFCFIVEKVQSSFLYGLFSSNNKPLDLLALETKAFIKSPFAEIQYIQVYKNVYNEALETEFHFPRTDNSIFYKFEAVFKNQTIIGQILEKEQAKKQYEWNLERGNTVAYSERNALTPDVMQIKVGNIPPQESVEIKFSVIQPLEVVINKYWGFTLPSVLTERYAPASVDMEQAANIQNVDLKNSNYKDWKLYVEIKSDQPFTFINNPSHNFEPEITESASRWNSKIYKATWSLTIIPNKNFVVYFKQERIESPKTILASHPRFENDLVLFFNFVPQMNNINSELAESKLKIGPKGFLQLVKILLDEDIQSAKGEFIFVIDRSGSMSGNRIVNLQRALIKFLQILPQNSYFNIISFGSTYSLYSHQSVKYTPRSLKEVLNWVSVIGADMGGTEIFSALQAVTQIQNIEGFPRTVMLLTDGDVYNPDQVINHARENSDKMRFCSVGIGHGASEYLVKNIGRAGKCTSEFVLDNEDIGEKADYMIKAATSQYIDDIKFGVDCFNEKNEVVYHEEEKSGLLLKDQPFKKWVYLKDLPKIKMCKARIEYFNSWKQTRVIDELINDEFILPEITETWHKIAYDNKIRELDLLTKTGKKNVEEIKSQIVNLSVKYQVLSDYTSFLAVIQESTVAPEIGSKKVTIPNLNSADNTIHENPRYYQAYAPHYALTFAWVIGLILSYILLFLE